MTLFRLYQRVSFLIDNQPAFGEIVSIFRCTDTGTVIYTCEIGDGTSYLRDADELSDASDVRVPVRRGKGKR